MSSVFFQRRKLGRGIVNDQTEEDELSSFSLCNHYVSSLPADTSFCAKVMGQRSCSVFYEPRKRLVLHTIILNRHIIGKLSLCVQLSLPLLFF